MKTTLIIIAAATMSANVYGAQPNDAFTNNADTSDTVLLDVGQPSSMNPIRKSTGYLNPVIASESNTGSVLFDLDQDAGHHTVSTQPAIGDAADDYGSILYDAGSRY